MQIIECDRCGKQTAGHIVEPHTSMQMYGMAQTGMTAVERSPSVSGWRLVDGKLLCDGCVGDLNEWLKPLPRAAP